MTHGICTSLTRVTVVRAATKDGEHKLMFYSMNDWVIDDATAASAQLGDVDAAWNEPADASDPAADDDARPDGEDSGASWDSGA